MDGSQYEVYPSYHHIANLFFTNSFLVHTVFFISAILFSIIYHLLILTAINVSALLRLATIRTK